MRTAISVGALALTLGGALSFTAPAPASAAARAGDCEGGGLLGGVTGGLCKAVDTVGEVVNGITGGPPPDPGVLDHVAETALNGVDDMSGTAGVGGDGGTGTQGFPQATVPAPDAEVLATPKAVETTAETAKETAQETAKETGEGGPPPKGFDGGCPPQTGSAECASSSTISPFGEAARPSASPRPGPPRRSRRTSTGDVEPAPPPRPAEAGPRGTDEDEDETGGGISGSPPTVDAEAPRLELLWPAGPVIRKLQRAVTPTRSPDPLGTALTAALLVAAILAVRVLYARRIGEESIPLEPLRMRRQRTA